MAFKDQQRRLWHFIRQYLKNKIMIYIGLIVILFFLFVTEYRLRKNISYTFWLGTFFFIALFAFRGDNVGGDTIEYCRYFEGKTSSTYGSLKSNDDIEIGFRWVCMALQKVSLSRFWFLFSTSLLSLIPFVLIVKKYSIFHFFVLLLFL